MKHLFELRGSIDKNTSKILSITGFLLTLLTWLTITYFEFVPSSILPNPIDVIASFKSLIVNDGLVYNVIYSLKLNFLGYLEAVVIAIPLGFLIGLIPLFKGLWMNQFNAIRFLPLTAITGLFIAWFGIDDPMKIHFLAFGIFVYLLPVTVERIMNVEKVYVDTVSTLGATKWQTVKTVFIPGVLSKLFDDIRVLVAISWTYIIVAELINKTSGVGALTYTFARQSRIDKVFAILIVIIIIGYLQDQLFKFLDRLFFKFKYETEKK